MVLTAGAECCKNTFTAVNPLVTDKKRKKRKKKHTKKSTELKTRSQLRSLGPNTFRVPLLGSGPSEQSYKG